MDNKIEILYVDDESINRQLFDINFSREYNVFIASDGFLGFNVLEKKPNILVVISDMKMPNMTGIEFIIKAKQYYPEKKYFILTGFEITDEIRNAIETGLILNYFRKPFNIKEIELSINEAIRKPE